MTAFSTDNINEGTANTSVTDKMENSNMIEVHTINYIASSVIVLVSVDGCECSFG